MSEPRRDLTHTLFSVLVIGALLLGSLWTLRPFLPALLWSAMIVVATWPLTLRVQALLWNRRWLAVTVMLLLMLVVFVVPFVLAIGAVISHTDQFADWAKSLSQFTLPLPPDWLRDLPAVGEKLDAAWRRIAASGMSELAANLEPYTRDVLRWLAAQAGSAGLIAVQLVLGMFVTGILYTNAEACRAYVRRVGRRLAGERGEAAVILAGQAIRAVAIGVVVTALAQAVIGGIGLAVAGVPFATVLTALMFLLAVTQIGAAPVMFCAAAWVYWKGSTGWAITLLVWTAVVAGLDNVLRPFLIRQGADLPLLLIFAGVIGGLLAFGLVGLFVGPAVLAVAYTLLDDWLQE